MLSAECGCHGQQLVFAGPHEMPALTTVMPEARLWIPQRPSAAVCLQQNLTGAPCTFYYAMTPDAETSPDASLAQRGGAQ